jgi:hypothetical protein
MILNQFISVVPWKQLRAKFKWPLAHTMEDQAAAAASRTMLEYLTLFDECECIAALRHAL